MIAMENEKTEQCTSEWCGFKGTVQEHVHGHGCGCGGALYGLGFLGALVYQLTTATSLWAGVIGVVKALLWPAFLVYELMKYLGM
jgi:hypothetical protein